MTHFKICDILYLTLTNRRDCFMTLIDENLIDQKVIYTLEMNGKLFLIENVPARVNVETGEQFFSSKTVDRLQQIVWDQQQPINTGTLPVYEYTN